MLWESVMKAGSLDFMELKWLFECLIWGCLRELLWEVMFCREMCFVGENDAWRKCSVLRSMLIFDDFACFGKVRLMGKAGPWESMNISVTSIKSKMGNCFVVLCFSCMIYWYY
jgi:hypothetical protein